MRMIVIAALALGLAACGGPEVVSVPEIGFSGGAVVRLEAERPAEIVDDYRPPLRAPHVEHLYRVSPSQVARVWLRDRVALSGNGGLVRMTINDASVIEEDLETEGGLFGMFRSDPEKRLTARLDVTLNYVGIAGAAGSSRAMAEVSRTILQGMNEADVEAAYFEMIQALADAFDAEMKARIDETYTRVFQSVG